MSGGIDWDDVHRVIAETAASLHGWAERRLAADPLEVCACGAEVVDINPIPAQLTVILFCVGCGRCRGVYELGKS